MAWHGSVVGSGTKDDLQPLSSQLTAHTPTFFWFSEVFWPHHVTECRTSGLSALWEKDPGDVAWAPQLFAWRNKPQDLKEQLQKIPMLRFVLSTSKSIVFLQPWQFSISKTITVSKNDSQSFHLCNKWGSGFKRVMHWPSPTSHCNPWQSSSWRQQE